MDRFVRIGKATRAGAALRALGLAALLGQAWPAPAAELWEPPSSGQPASDQAASDQPPSDQPSPAHGSSSQADKASPDSTSTAPSDTAVPSQGKAVETIPVKAQQEETPAARDATRLETIEVTSQKRVKAQRDIPGSVGAIRGADLEAMHAQGMRDYLKLIPGVVFADQGNEESVPVIRGIATSVGFGATAVTTGVYVDDMPFGDLFVPSSVPDINPFDLERVEVLKGPQGTLFGSGALAGAIRYIVQKPERGIWQGKVMGTISQTALSDGLSPVTAAAVNAPLFGDAAALRAVGVWRTDSGLYDMGAHDSNGNTLRADKDADRGRQTSARVLGSWDPTDDLKLSAFWFDQKSRNDDFGLTETLDTPASDDFPFASPREHDFGGYNLTATYDLSWAKLFSSTNRMTKHNYTDGHNEFGFGIENQNQNEYVVVSRDDVRGWTQELRLSSPEGDAGPWEWLIGGSHLNYGDKGFFYSYIGPDMPDPTTTEQGNAQKDAAQVFSTSDQVAYETALFGEVTRRLGSYFELTAGARDYETKLKANTLLCGAQIVALFQEQCYPQQFDDKSKGLNPKFSLRYLHSRNMQVYLLAAKGFQFGGIQVNPPAPGFPQSAEQAGYHFGPYKSSNLWNYEMGLRTEWLDRRLRWDTTFFYLDWKDLQMTVAVPLSGTNLQFTVIGNVGRAHSQGVESAFEVIPFDGAKFSSSVLMMTAVTDVLFDPNAGDGGVKPGTQLPGAPRFQWASVASYEHSLPYLTSWVAGPTLTYAYVGESPDQIRPTGTVGGYGTLDARLDFSQPGSRFQPSLSIGLNNIGDVRGVAYHVGGNKASDGSPFEYRHFIPPRTAVLSLSLRY